jgi:hypothetical protein
VNGRPEGHEISHAKYDYYRDHATVFTEVAIDANVRMLTDTETGGVKHRATDAVAAAELPGLASNSSA